MRIGFIIHFFDFRNDVRKVITTLIKKHEVVLFVQEKDLEIVQPHVPKGAVIRVVKERKKTVWNYFWEQQFRLFGKLPKSVNNYYLMEMFKISLNPNAKIRNRAKRILTLAMKFPKWLAYDHYLSKLNYRGETEIADIDKFICFTDIYDDYILARLIREKKKLTVYVYSWDHPCKHKRFSKLVNYLVWNEKLKNDVVELQRINSNQIQIKGSSQFAYIHQFRSIPKEKLSNPFPFPYIYFGCAIGIPEIAIKEVSVIEVVSQVLSKFNPAMKLVVRPYPALKDWGAYKNLKSLPNVELDDQYKSKDLSVEESHLIDKFIRIYFAEAFLHLGTTLGFEACFIETPSIILDFESFRQDSSLLSLYNFVHQYQNEKYLLLNKYPNVVPSEIKLLQTFEALFSDRNNFLSYNKAVISSTPIKSFEDFAQHLIQD